MYNAPIKLFELPIKTIVEEKESAILAKVQACFDVDVDKAELLRALQYDRNQYEKGYADGKADARTELVRCKDCKYRGDEVKCPMCFDETYAIDEGDGYWDTGYTFHDRTKDDTFCSYGERKDNDD